MHIASADKDVSTLRKPKGKINLDAVAVVNLFFFFSKMNSRTASKQRNKWPVMGLSNLEYIIVVVFLEDCS